MSAITDITQKGWTNTEFDVPIDIRAHYTALGNQVIDLAMQDEVIHGALTFTLLDSDDKRVRQANLFTVSPALHSADDKLWLHVGYQTRQHVEAALGENIPSVLQEFLDLTDKMLAAIEKSFTTMLHLIDATEAIPAILHPDVFQRVIHIRIVRYLNARKPTAALEPVSGHGDMSLCTLHLYETHGNWFQAVPYPQELINNDEDSQKNESIAAMRSRLKTIEAIEDHPIFFLGAGWKHLGINTLPACYHAGVRPDPSREFISPYATQVVGDSDDRVSLVVFAQPSLEYVQQNDFTYASVVECRPDTAVEL